MAGVLGSEFPLIVLILAQTSTYYLEDCYRIENPIKPCPTLEVYGSVGSCVVTDTNITLRNKNSI